MIGLARVVDLQAQAPAQVLDSICANGDPRAAISACNRLLALATQHTAGTDTMFFARTTLYVNRGNAHDNLGETESALADYDSALALNPSNAHAYWNKGVTLYRLGRLKEAHRAYDAAIRANPSYANAWISRADLLREAADTAADPVPLEVEAILEYDRALALGIEEDGRRWPVYGNRGYLEYHLHRFTEAIADFTAAIQLRPSTDLYVARAASYADVGDRGRALKDVDAAARFASTPSDSQAVRGIRDYVTRKQH